MWAETEFIAISTICLIQSNQNVILKCMCLVSHDTYYKNKSLHLVEDRQREFCMISGHVRSFGTINISKMSVSLF